MSVQTQIDRINQNVANTYAVLSALGADMPNEQSSDNLASTAGTTKAVLHSKQTLTVAQQAQARTNIGAASQEEVSQLSENKADKTGMTLGRDANGLLYLYVDGAPVGNGVELPTGGIDGYVDSDKNIVVRGLPDGAYKFYFEMEDGSLSDGYDLVKDSNVYYTVTNNLTQCTNSNSAKQVIGGQSYSATITANSGYELKSVTVTMGGSPVSVSGGKITIANVTGDIVITAVAEEVQTATNFADPTSSDWWADSYLSSSADVRNKAGYVVSNFIGPLNAGDVILVTGIDMTGTITEYRSAPYKSDKKLHGSYGVIILAAKTTSAASNITVSATGGEFTNVASDVVYWRIGGLLNSSANDVVINIKRNGEWL